MVDHPHTDTGTLTGGLASEIAPPFPLDDTPDLVRPDGNTLIQHSDCKSARAAEVPQDANDCARETILAGIVEYTVDRLLDQIMVDRGIEMLQKILTAAERAKPEGGDLVYRRA